MPQSIGRTQKGVRVKQLSPREEVFLKIITLLNKRHLQGKRFLYNCGELGYALIYWQSGHWEVDWYDKALEIGKTK